MIALPMADHEQKVTGDDRGRVQVHRLVRGIPTA
jgi:hypothetical protein